MKQIPEFGYHVIGIFVRKDAMTVNWTSHIEILRKDLHVYIIGDAYRTVPYAVNTTNGNKTLRIKNNFTLDASESNDPNFINNQSMITFEWSCRIVNMTYDAQINASDKSCHSSDFVPLKDHIVLKNDQSVLKLSNIIPSC